MKNYYQKISYLIIGIAVIVGLVFVLYFNNTFSSIFFRTSSDGQFVSPDTTYFREENSAYLRSKELLVKFPYRGPQFRPDMKSESEKVRAMNSSEENKLLDQIERDLYKDPLVFVSTMNEELPDSDPKKYSYSKVRLIDLTNTIENSKGEKILLVYSTTISIVDKQLLETLGEDNKDYKIGDSFSSGGGIEVIKQNSDGNFEYLASTQQAIMCQDLVNEGFTGVVGCFDAQTGKYQGGVESLPEYQKVN